MKRVSIITGLLLGSTFSVAVCTHVQAADMDYPIRGTTEYTSVEYGSGWYLRGDVGFAIHSGGNGAYHSTTYGDDTAYSSEALGANESYSIGAGYIFNNSVRADLTLEVNTGVDWEGRSKAAPCDGTLTAGDCLFEADAEMKRTTLMANGYYTMGGWAGFRPYVGAGIGVSDVSWSDYDFQQLCHVDVGETCGFGNHSGVGTDRETYYGPAGSVTTSSGLALTYALAAGVDYRIDKNWLVDLGYKWTHISNSLMIEEDADGVGAPGGDSTFDAINLHEVRIGLRYEVW